MIAIEYLDHVAIRAQDIHKSAEWYETVLGLKKVQVKEWGEYPIFMLAGATGIALFPPKVQTATNLPGKAAIFIDHFAFRVSGENFEKAKTHFDNLGIAYQYQDHYYFDSLYIKDPDGHTVELTTQVKELS